MIGRISDLKNFFEFALLIILSVSLSACQGGATSSRKGHAKAYRMLSKDDRGNIKYRGHYKVGKPYKIKGRRYKPREVSRYTRTGVASWYGKRHGFHGKKTANGDIYNKEMLTAAHKTQWLTNRQSL